jgi:hypothetical protein
MGGKANNIGRFSLFCVHRFSFSTTTKLGEKREKKKVPSLMAILAGPASEFGARASEKDS